MKIGELYRRYRLPENLQTHQLQVAAVASTICDHFAGDPIDKNSIIKACLLHDMGNLVKFDLSKFPELLEPQGVTYWEEIQAEMRERYGWDEYVMTELIAVEIGVDERILELIQVTAFNKIEAIYETNDYEVKIVQYSDSRVGMNGVTSVEARLKDMYKRYQDKYPDEDNELKAQKIDLMLGIEAQIFKHADISPDQITNQTISATISSLKNMVI